MGGSKKRGRALAQLEAVRKGSRFPIRIRRASRRGRGGVFDLAIVVGRFHALPPSSRLFEKPIGAQLEALRLRMGRTRAEAQRCKGGERGRCTCEVEVIPATGLVGWKR